LLPKFSKINKFKGKNITIINVGYCILRFFVISFFYRNFKKYVKIWKSGDESMRNGESWYDTAQVCLNGHAIKDTVIKHPEHNKDFCDRCGAKTITACQVCNASIRGE
jgi:hypothetical protein